MILSTEHSGIWLESKFSGYGNPSYTGGINMVGTPIRFFLGAENSAETNGKFQVHNYNSQFASNPTPLFEVDSTIGKAKFDGVNVEVNNGTLKVGGSPVLTSALSSLAIGSGSTSTGTNSFTSGNSVAATGVNAGAFGLGNTAQGYNQFVIGQYNTPLGTGTANLNWNDPLFIIGNGTSDTARSNAFAVDRSGAVRMSHTLAVGSGSVASGNKSVAMGESNAAGPYSTALGVSATSAAAFYGTAMGLSSAHAWYATAMGNSLATGELSTAIGRSTASAKYATAIGAGSVATAYASTVIGSYNVNPSTPSYTEWVAQDDVFVIGNGVDASTRSNALVVKKSGSLAAGTGTVIGTVPAGSSQIVVGNYNDTSTDNSTTPATVRANGVFSVGIGTTPSARKNALRVTASGNLLIQPSGELGMGAFTSGEKP